MVGQDGGGEKLGERTINRPRDYEETKRREEKWKKTNWFKTTVLFCPWTPNGELAKRWREVEESGAVTRDKRIAMIAMIDCHDSHDCWILSFNQHQPHPTLKTSWGPIHIKPQGFDEIK